MERQIQPQLGSYIVPQSHVNHGYFNKTNGFVACTKPWAWNNGFCAHGFVYLFSMQFECKKDLWKLIHSIVIPLLVNTIVIPLKVQCSNLAYHVWLICIIILFPTWGSFTLCVESTTTTATHNTWVCSTRKKTKVFIPLLKGGGLIMPFLTRW